MEELIDMLFNPNYEDPEMKEIQMLKELTLSMNGTEYKEYHENYFKYNEGSTAFEPFNSIYFTFLCTLYVCISGVRLVGWRELVLEYMIIGLPMIIFNIIYVRTMHTVNLTVTCLFILEVMKRKPYIKFVESFKKLNKFPRSHSYALTCARGLTYLITAFCIFAVDFRSFPKRFAKTWKYGFSLMDTGTGLFVVLSGFVHKHVSNENLLNIALANYKILVTLVCLGIVRYGMINAFDYQEQVQEYGVHWNFFYSLGVSKLLSLCLLYFSNTPLIFAVGTLAFHEMLLLRWEKYIVNFDIPRVDFVSSNKEGIISCLGYTAMYLFGVYFKSILTNTKLPRYKVLLKFVQAGCISFTVFYLMHQYRPISRVMANTAYCMYVITLLLFFMSVLYTFEVLFSENRFLSFEPPEILSLINENGLIFFLVSNLFTGFVNKNLRTLLQPFSFSFVVMNLYLYALFTVIQHLNYYDIVL